MLKERKEELQILYIGEIPRVISVVWIPQKKRDKKNPPSLCLRQAIQPKVAKMAK